MAGFKTHIGVSTAVGIGYGAAGFAMGVPEAACVLAGGLCSVSGMLPDLDSDSGIPLRESIAFAAAVVPIMMVDRLQHLGLSTESIVLVGGAIYLLIRFVVVEIFKRYTVHRGMWHSIPAAATAGLLAFLIVSGEDMSVRLFKTAAVVLGFLTHLVLDELWSIELSRGRLRIKKSFGTALKLYSRRSTWANVSTYGKLIVLAALAWGDPLLMEHFGYDDHTVPHTAKEWINEVIVHGEQLIRR